MRTDCIEQGTLLSALWRPKWEGKPKRRGNICIHGASQVALVVKNSPANAGDIRDLGSIPGLGRCPGKGNGNPLQDSCLENPMDGGAWWATVHGVSKSRTQLSDLTSNF